MSTHNKSKIIWSTAASRDIVRLRSFIESHNKEASHRAVSIISKAASMLMDYPAIGTIVEGKEAKHERELTIPFGQRGYAMRYRVEDDTVVILRIWHGLEEK